jgi:hypothetical protein
MIRFLLCGAWRESNDDTEGTVFVLCVVAEELGMREWELMVVGLWECAGQLSLTAMSGWI